MTLKRTMCALLAATMLVPTAVVGEIAASAAEVDVSESSATVSEEASEAGSYGLANSIQDGVILHCFDWKYSDITAELPNIAAAGFTSVQTSPAQPDGSGAWYWLYQPKGFYIGNNGLGTKAELTTLCSEAEKYGIKVVVDVVANHLNGVTSSVQSDLQDNQYWHTYGAVSDWGDRYQVIYGEIGMRDLATENSYVQSKVKGYIEELKGIGVDGIRWDAAKHIGLPGEQGDFWPTVTSVSGMWNYGEILDDPGGDAESIMKQYTNYISITDAGYGHTLRNAFYSGGVPKSYANWAARGLTSDKIVYWGESHDTWANAYDWGYSHHMSQNVIDRCYAVVAARNLATSLYFSRPFSDPSAKENTHVGDKGSTHFTSKEVAEVNKFHNAMIGKADYYTASNGCSVITRKDGGAVIVKGSGSGQVSVANGGGYAKAGTYKDAVSGNTFTVTSSTISGTIGDTGIAVIYDATPVLGVSASVESGTTFTDTLSVTLNAKNVSTASYKTSEGASGTYTDGQTIVVGASTAEGGSVTLDLTGVDSDGKTTTAQYKYNKKGGIPVLDNPGFIFDNSSTNWSTVNAYVYDESGSSVISNGAWPGVKMTDCGDGYWKYELDSKFSSSSNVQVIFNNGSDQIPGSQQPGYKMTSTDKKIYEGGTWKDAPASLNVTLSVSSSSVNVGDTVTLTASATGASGSVTYTFSDGSAQIQSSSSNTAKWTPSTDGQHTITVTAKDSKTSKSSSITVNVLKPQGPSVTVDKASGTSFNTEVTSLNLTLSNATSGTYSVDDGPVKSFTGSKTITIGEGKIGDSVVTVKTTATDGKTTNTSTFTYNKVYQKKTSASSGSSSKVTAASTATVGTEESGAALASQYKTNQNGFGKQKTISIDGDISDWSSDMLIAQGAANDDPRVYRPNSMYELPVDLYALYGAYDDNNVYLMWEMTNVQDVVAPGDDYPISQGILWQTQELPFFIAVDTGKSDTVGKNGQLQTAGTIWNSGMTITSKFNRLISINTKGGNGPFVYSGDSTGLNPVEIYNAKTSGIKMGYGKGILSSTVKGINGAYGASNNRVVGDVCNNSAAWVDFNTKGHNSSSIDFFYELSIPYSELGITKSDVTSKGVGVMLVATFGMSGMDCLPYDVSMNDNADQPDTQSQENNSFEKSDSDNITAAFARIGSGSPDTDYDDSDSDTDTEDTLPLQVNFGTNKSAPQYTTTALTLKGIGYGGTAPYKYQFSVDNKVVKSSSTTATYTWTPSTSGSHTISCVITDSTGKTATVSKTFTAEGDDTDTDSDTDSDVAELKNNSKVSSSSVSVNTKVTITGAATGGTGSYTYTFFYRKSTTSQWTSLTASSGKATFTPTSAGTYYVMVNVMDSDGNIVPKTLTVKATQDNVLTNNSTFSATSVKAGTSVTATASASGGTSPYTYAYYYKKSSASSWTTKKAYSSTTSVAYTFNTAGEYILKVAVKDSDGTIVEQESPLTVISVTPLTNSSTISATAVTPGTSFTATAKASGGTSPYTYAYYYKKSTASSWTTRKAYSSTTSVAYTFNTAGTYDIKVSVKDSTGTVEDKTFSVTVGQTEITNNSTLSSTVVKPGTSITATASAEGGTGSFTYAFWWQKMGGSGWNTKKAYSTSKTATYTFNTAGAYNVRISAKDSSGKIKSVTYHVYITTLTNSSTLSSTSVSKGTAIKATGKSSNGSGTKEYAFYWKKTTSSTWTTKSAYGVASTATYTFNTAGTYDIRISVKDSTGAVVFKDYTVTVK